VLQTSKNLLFEAPISKSCKLITYSIVDDGCESDSFESLKHLSKEVEILPFSKPTDLVLVITLG
jgi:hypothetical protein